MQGAVKHTYASNVCQSQADVEASPEILPGLAILNTSVALVKRQVMTVIARVQVLTPF